MPDAQNNACVVLVTAPDAAVAQQLARLVLEQKLAACINIIPAMTSFFWWQGKIDEQTETLLIIKTVAEKLTVLIEAVKKNHPYEVPEIIALPVVGGSEDYLKWLRDSVE
jgi:periplasmic divalent cation tolerance protein